MAARVVRVITVSQLQSIIHFSHDPTHLRLTPLCFHDHLLTLKSFNHPPSRPWSGPAWPMPKR